MGLPNSKRRPGRGGGATVLFGNEIAAQNSANAEKSKAPRLRLIAHPSQSSSTLGATSLMSCTRTGAASSARQSARGCADTLPRRSGGSRGR